MVTTPTGDATISDPEDTNSLHTDEATGPDGDRIHDEGGIRPFAAEIAQLFRIFVNSVYSDRDVFLRELVANAADATEKRRFLSSTSGDSSLESGQLAIEIECDPKRGTLAIRDEGVGMNGEDMHANLGRIASSGTRTFLKNAGSESESSTDTVDNKLIGEFGIGFYSAFMVADKVVVTSRKLGEKLAYRWTSTGVDGYRLDELSAVDSEAIPLGTTVLLHIGAKSKDYLLHPTIERIVQQHLTHISFPIRLRDGVTTRDLTDGTALWSRSPRTVQESEYTSLFQSIAGTNGEPRLTIHFHAEGLESFQALVFLPDLPTGNLFEPSREARLRLFVRRVLITTEANILPGYLRFLRGVVDAEDLPLNVSREMLQSTPVLGRIKAALSKRIVREMKAMSKKRSDDWEEVWKHFGSVIKEGLYEDADRVEDLLELCRFQSLGALGGKLRSLEDYVSSMIPGQKHIYFLTGEDADRLRSSPLVERLRARGVDVLLMTDPVDPFWLFQQRRFRDFDFRSVEASEGDLVDPGSSDEDAKVKNRSGEEDDDSPSDRSLALLIARTQQTLGTAVSSVRKTMRLTESPCCLVPIDGGIGRHLNRQLSRQQRMEPPGEAQSVLEINPNHPLIGLLAERINEKSQFEAIDRVLWILFENARILDGEDLHDPVRFSRSLSDTMIASLAGLSTEISESGHDEATSLDS